MRDRADGKKRKMKKAEKVKRKQSSGQCLEQTGLGAETAIEVDD